MIISPKHGFVFVHIPKCAGTSIRWQLEACDETNISLAEPGTHPELGRIDYGHIPLGVLRTHFPEHYGHLQRLDAFAVVRDPLDRFGSALRQSLWQYEKRPMTLIPRDELRELTLRVLEEIEGQIESLSHRHVFFSRQADFIFDGDRQVVDYLVPLDLTADLIAYFSRRTGVRLDAERRSNQNVELRFKSLGGIAYRANDILRRRLPPNLHEGLKRRVLRLMAARGSAAEAAGVLDLPEVRAFVAEHYGEDLRIFGEVARRRADIRAALQDGDLSGIVGLAAHTPDPNRAARGALA